ncbi:universal stress protein uspa-like protein [Halogeometricum pallidum JCM 14848]|uniref:Universal stress protein uspa-like protein n=1 Tax=Halogeometricum pallidum JCM 14848 TaxID=1227487 RepID=M0D6P8_HALPD|nr:universal stress protein [Halogeometricum pallidum]ELZ31171.1 universal stress protein uspa-like protein [Halogeometricum pallidum JCM 14848]
MDILAPIDGSDCSDRAVTFAAELAARFEAELHVVHFSDAETDATDIVLGRAREAVESAGLDSEPELSILEMDVTPGDQVGREILRLVEERGFDHVVMGHHGSGTIERAILGSAADTVVHDESVPVTIVP